MFHLRWGRLPDELHFTRLPGCRHLATVVVQRLLSSGVCGPRTPFSNPQPSFGLNGYIKRVIRRIGIRAGERCRARGECSRRGTHIEIHLDDRSGASIHSTQIVGDRVAAGTAGSWVVLTDQG